MLALQLLIFAIVFFMIPFLVGGIFSDKTNAGEKLVFTWVSGQIMLWTVFQLLCVTYVLMEKNFHEVVNVFRLMTVLLALLGFFCHMRKRIYIGRKQSKIVPKMTGKTEIVSWVIFGVLLFVQLILAVLLAYEEGDDAYYVAISTITVESDTMFMKYPYTGGLTELDARHGLAPFPIWAAYIAKITGIQSVTMLQVVLPIGLIVMTYGIYSLIGSKLLGKRKEWLPVFMVFVAVCVIWGGYSTYAAENFLLVRTAQGKAVIANIIIPFMVYLLYRILILLEENSKASVKLWILVGMTMASGCLCSTLGSLLTCMLLGIVVMVSTVCYKRWSLLFPMALCCACPIMYALLYLLM